MADGRRAGCARPAPRRRSWSTPTPATATRSTSSRTVELWEQAGASGMFLEDQVWPKRCGHMAGKQVVPSGGLAGQAARRRRPPHAPPRHGPHRRPRRGRPRRGARAGPDGPRRRASTRCSSRRPSRSPSSRRIAARAARHHARRQHGRDGPDPAADAGRAGRPRVHADRVAAHRAVRRWSRRSATRSAILRDEGHAARRPRPAGRPSTSSPTWSTWSGTSRSATTARSGRRAGRVTRYATSQRASRVTSRPPAVRGPATWVGSPKVPPAGRPAGAVEMWSGARQADPGNERFRSRECAGRTDEHRPRGGGR